jgi:ABC-type branched-subunit amino acid transport system substrate-binding protein
MSGPKKEKQRPCDEWAEKLTQVDRLSAVEQVALDEHVRSCAGCAAAMTQYRLLHAYLYRSLAAEPLTTLPSVRQRRPRPRFQLPTLVAFLPAAAGIALLVGLLFLILGQLITQIIAHVPGTALVWTMPLTPLATALILALFVVTRETLPALNDSSPRPSASHRPSQQSLPQTGSLGSVKKIAESSPGLARRSGWRYRGLLLIVILSLLAVSVSSLAILALNPSLIHPDVPPTLVEPAEPTGISIDGSQAFDVSRPNGDLKLAAAAKIREHDIPAAQALWQQAVTVDSGDAETRIYQEDQRVLASHHSYFTLVIGTILGKGYLSGGRDDLQGAYIAQHEYNDQVEQMRNARPLLRLLVASSTFDTVSPAQVARRVVEETRRDATIKGVMGWPTTASAQASLPILAAAHIPMLSASASGDTLTGQSPYFFRLSPTNTVQEEFAARYVKKILHAKRVAMFEDPNDPFSRTLADAFEKYFVDADHTIILQANYTKGHPETLPALVKQAIALHPDLLYFSGYASDASMVLKNLPACTPTSCLLVMGGEAFYLQADYALDDLANYTRLRFTSFAFPGLWRIQHREQPRFFQDYAQTFDPNGQYRAGTYGYNQPEGHTILSYDAIQVLLSASNSIQDLSSFTSEDLRQTLTHITPSQPFQGVSGPIAFGPNGDNTLGKVMVLAGNIHGSPDGNIRLDYGEEVP